MKNFNVITMPGGEQHVTYVGPPLSTTSPPPPIRIRGIVTAEKLIAAGMAADIIYRQTLSRPTLVIPYFPGARQDRIEDSPNVGFSLQVYSLIVGSFPWDRIVILDPHSTATPVNVAFGANYFEDPRQFTYINHEDWFLPWLDAQTFEPAEHTFLFPDKGADAKYGLVPAYSPSRSCTKKRDPATGKLSGFEVPSLTDWKGNHVWIVDDICDGGGTFVEIAKKIRQQLRHDVTLGLAVSHGLFSNYDNAVILERLFDYIVTTDSVIQPPKDPRDLPLFQGLDEFKFSKVQVQPLTPILKGLGIDA